MTLVPNRSDSRESHRLSLSEVNGASPSTQLAKDKMVVKRFLHSITMTFLVCCTNSTYSQDTQAVSKASTTVDGLSIADEHGSVVAKKIKLQSKLKDGHSVMISFVAPDGSGYCRLEAGKLIVFKEENERDGTAVNQRNADPGDWRITSPYRLPDGTEQGVWIKESLLP